MAVEGGPEPGDAPLDLLFGIVGSSAGEHEQSKGIVEHGGKFAASYQGLHILRLNQKDLQLHSEGRTKEPGRLIALLLGFLSGGSGLPSISKRKGGSWR